MADMDDPGTPPQGVPLPPVPSSNQGPRNADDGGAHAAPVIPGEHPVPPKGPRNIGRTVVLTLIGMVVVFGFGYAVGQMFTSGGTSDADKPVPCTTVSAVPAYLPPAEVSVKVLNSSAPSGTAAKTGSALEALGFTIVTVGNGTTSNPTQGAVIRYGPATGLLAAQTLQAYILGETVLESAPDLAGNTVELILQAQFGGVASAEQAQANLTKPVPSTSPAGCGSPTPTPVPAASSPAAPSPSGSGGSGSPSATPSPSGSATKSASASTSGSPRA